MSITYQRTEDDEPQPVDEHGRLPDGTQVMFFPDDIATNGGIIRFEAGYFSNDNPIEQ